MSIFTRFGDCVELVRLATLEDVKTFERRKVDKEDRERTRDGWRAIAKYVGGPNLHHSTYNTSGKKILVDASYLKATEGWSEISNAFQALKVKAGAS